MIGSIHPFRAPMASGAAHPLPSGAAHPLPSGATPAATGCATATPVGSAPGAGPPVAAEPILCGHCGRTASNGISCQGMCVADSGY